MTKKIVILIFLINILGVYLYLRPVAVKEVRVEGYLISEEELGDLKVAYPDLVELINTLKKDIVEVNNNPGDLSKLAALGLSWKGLGNYIESYGGENYKEYYMEALAVYEEAVLLTESKNTLFLTNAAKMEINLGNYEKAEGYYQVAIEFSPGDNVLYVELAELYEYLMNKSEEEIVDVYESGMERVLQPKFLRSRMNSYLERLESAG